MGKVLIVSDSHGLRSELQELKNRHKGEVELFIHCGDSELTSSDKEIQQYAVVSGNCDYEPAFKNELIREAGGLRFLVVHGHQHSVKTSLMKLAYRAGEVSAQVICFGHSHMLGAEMVDGKLYINPGSLLLPRGRHEKTYCILDIQKDTIKLHVYDYEQGEMMDLQRSFDYNVFNT